MSMQSIKHDDHTMYGRVVEKYVCKVFVSREMHAMQADREVCY
jgi:hypothetical protein